MQAGHSAWQMPVPCQRPHGVSALMGSSSRCARSQLPAGAGVWSKRSRVPSRRTEPLALVDLTVLDLARLVLNDGPVRTERLERVLTDSYASTDVRIGSNSASQSAVGQSATIVSRPPGVLPVWAGRSAKGGHNRLRIEDLDFRTGLHAGSDRNE